MDRLDLGSVEGWADTYLRLIDGIDIADVQAWREAFPTPTPPPNPDLIFEAGTPSNPWSLAMAIAEGALADALQVYLYAGRNLMTQAAAADLYARSGVDGLAGAIWSLEDSDFKQWVGDMIRDKMIRSYENIFEGMLLHFLNDYWPEQKPFKVRVA